MDTHDVDKFLDKAGNDPWDLLGRKVEWHGQSGTVVMVPSPTGRHRIGIEISIGVSCRQDCGKRVNLTTISGLHNGAFCYVVDKDGNYVANLRDEVVACPDHGTGR